jgi:hypothetical protein
VFTRGGDCSLGYMHDKEVQEVALACVRSELDRYTYAHKPSQASQTAANGTIHVNACKQKAAQLRYLVEGLLSWVPVRRMVKVIRPCGLYNNLDSMNEYAWSSFPRQDVVNTTTNRRRATRGSSNRATKTRAYSIVYLKK